MIENIDGTAPLAKEEYAGICDELKWLRALEAAGVDNWENYEHAIDIYFEGD